MNDITLVIVDTTNDKEISRRTIEHCQSIFPCKEAIIFTEKPIQTSVKNVSTTCVRSNEEYNSFVLSSLVNFVDTSHYLILQSDGYILNPSSWDPTYLNYDYIGAPWAHHPSHHWPPHAPVGPNNSVGNGGFSLRSVKLGLIVQKIYSHFLKYPTFTSDYWLPEDCFICRDIRPKLEERGCIFAPEEVALRFSCENKPYTNQFGFHGKTTMAMNNIAYK